MIFDCVLWFCEVPHHEYFEQVTVIFNAYLKDDDFQHNSADGIHESHRHGSKLLFIRVPGSMPSFLVRSAQARLDRKC